MSSLPPSSPKPASDPVMGPGGFRGTFGKGNGINIEKQNLYSDHCSLEYQVDTQQFHSGKPVSPKDICIASKRTFLISQARGEVIFVTVRNMKIKVGVHEIRYMNCESKVTGPLFCDSTV